MSHKHKKKKRKKKKYKYGNKCEVKDNIKQNVNRARRAYDYRNCQLTNSRDGIR